MLKLFLWLRYLRRRKIAFISIAAVALCVALLLATDSLLTGFVDKLESADLWTMGDLVFQTESAANPDEFVQRLRKIARKFQSEAQHIFPRQKTSAGVR